jgi:hypothetical protein
VVWKMSSVWVVLSGYCSVPFKVCLDENMTDGLKKVSAFSHSKDITTETWRIVSKNYRASPFQSTTQHRCDIEPQRSLNLLSFKALLDGNVTHSHKEVFCLVTCKARSKPIVTQLMQKLPNVRELAMKPESCVMTRWEILI